MDSLDVTPACLICCGLKLHSIDEEIVEFLMILQVEIKDKKSTHSAI